MASCGISENFSSCWAQPWAFPDFSPNLAQEIGEQCRLLLGVPLILFVKGWAPWSRWHRRSREGKEQHPWTTEFSLPLQRLPKTRVCLDRVRPRGRGRCGCKGVGRGGVQVWLRSVWQPSLPRTENYDARAGSTSAIYLLTLLAGVGQVSASTALRLGPLSSRLCFFPSGLASSPSSLTLAEKTPRFLLQILDVSREGYSRILRGGVLGELSFVSPPQQTLPLSHQSAA